MVELVDIDPNFQLATPYSIIDLATDRQTDRQTTVVIS